MAMVVSMKGGCKMQKAMLCGVGRTEDESRGSEVRRLLSPDFHGRC